MITMGHSGLGLFEPALQRALAKELTCKPLLSVIPVCPLCNQRPPRMRSDSVWLADMAVSGPWIPCCVYSSQEILSSGPQAEPKHKMWIPCQPQPSPAITLPLGVTLIALS